jgi:IclR family acetate operon transcriptional repressor
VPEQHERSGVPPRRQRPIRDPVGAYQALRTVHALERLAFRPMSVPELAVALQVHQRTARRLLRRLAAEDYVTLVPGARRRYRLTRRLAVLGRQAIAHDDVLGLAAPWVARLATQAGQPAGLWIPCYADVVCVLHAEPHDPTPEQMLRELAPAHASAPGKALLAHRERWRESLLAQRLRRCTPRTLTDPRDLVADLRRVRARGYATDTGEHDPDHRAIAAPVFQDHDPIAAIAVSVIDDAPPLIGNLTGAAARLTGTLTDD